MLIGKLAEEDSSPSKALKSKPMKIAYVLGYLAEQYGGPPRVALNVGEALARLGHSVSYRATGTEDDRQEFADAPFSVELFDTAWLRRWYRSPDLIRELTAQATSFDLFHMHEIWPHPVYAGVTIAHEVGAPCLITPHGSLQAWTLGRKRLKKSLYLALIGRKMLERVACLHAVTSSEAENFRAAGYRGPISIIPHGVQITKDMVLSDAAEAESYWPSLKDRPVVLFLSRLSPEKGLDQLIPLWADLVRNPIYRDALLVIAGPDDRGYQKVVEAMMDRYDVASNTLLTGMVRGAAKFALMKRADVFILPSYSENFGMVVAEALGCGTPIITTTGTPWEELERADAGRWVAPTGPELGGALRELLDMSDSDREAMARRGRRLVLEHYNWDTIARQYVTLYDCILQGKDIPLHPKPASLGVIRPWQRSDRACSRSRPDS